MLNALESLNENSLIVNNVRDTMSEPSGAQAQPLRSNSLLELASFYTKGNVHPQSPHPPKRNSLVLIQSERNYQN